MASKDEGLMYSDLEAGKLPQRTVTSGTDTSEIALESYYSRLQDIKESIDALDKNVQALAGIRRGDKTKEKEHSARELSQTISKDAHEIHFELKAVADDNWRMLERWQFSVSEGREWVREHLGAVQKFTRVLEEYKAGESAHLERVKQQLEKSILAVKPDTTELELRAMTERSENIKSSLNNLLASEDVRKSADDPESTPEDVKKLKKLRSRGKSMRSLGKKLLDMDHMLEELAVLAKNQNEFVKRIDAKETEKPKPVQSALADDEDNSDFVMDEKTRKRKRLVNLMILVSLAIGIPIIVVVIVLLAT